MKKLTTIFGAFLLAYVSIISCSSSSNDNKEITEAEVANTVDTLKVNNTIKSEPKKIQPANVSCQIYFKGFDITDEETGELSKGKVSERNEFKKSKSYTFCYDSESFHHITLNGSGKQLTFIIRAGNKQVFKKESFDLVDKYTFTSKDFAFEMGEKYSIVITQNETIIFNGSIDSQGCM